tara:strand:- start:930 stop:1592 length:663 start_codon:yes stop_codon:yes gene_type:complete
MNRINIIFDFDGVILDSNNLKTNAFKNISKRFGESESDALVKYHINHGGVSRFLKIKWFVENILKTKNEDLIRKLVEEYGCQVSKSFESCSFRTDLFQLKKKLRGTKWSIASGGKQDEIVNLLDQKSLLEIFDNGIYGSPRPKMEIVHKIVFNNESNEKNKFVLIGDSFYDYECAKNNGIKFIFASDWSDIKRPKDIFKNKNIPFIKGIEFLNLDLLKKI